MRLSEALRLVLGALLAVAHLLPIFFLLLRQEEKRRSRVPLVLYGVLSVIWGLAVSVAVDRTGLLPDGVLLIADYVAAGLLPLLAGGLISIVFQNLDRGGLWVWWGIGGLTSMVIAGLHLYLGPAQARQTMAVALLGWLALFAAAILFSAWAALRARLAFYRNRGVYLLLLLIPLLAGHMFARVPWVWYEVGLGLHLMGLMALVACTTTQELPNLKGRMRSFFGNLVVIVTTALLILAGLLVGRFVFLIWQDWTITLIASVILAVLLALVYQPLNRFITWFVNRVVQRDEYDLSGVLSEYGRTISNLLTLEQLATVAVGTISDALGVQRGALIMMARGVSRVTLRVTEGMGRVDEGEIYLALDSPILLHLIMSGEPFFQHDLEHRPELENVSPQEKAGLKALQMEIFLPILARDRVLGLLALGTLGSGEPYGQVEISFLNTLAQQTGVALQNAYLFSRMKGLYDKISSLNKDLRQAYSKLMKMDQAKTDFLSIASHELRTPLTVIQGYTDILEEMAGTPNLTPEQTLEIVGNLKTPIQRLATIVTSMLDASTIEVHALDLQFTDTMLKAVMSMALGPWRDPLEERGFELVLEGIDDIPPIKVDLQRLSQAFGNLISNALKYTPDGGCISIEARMVSDEEFEVVVTDTGVGIDANNHELIFEKFYRVGSLLLHSTSDTKFKGAGPGLGLHIARGVIDAHGGRIWVESEGYDEETCPGSAFHVLLPLEAAPPGPEDGNSDDPTPVPGM